MTAEKSPTKKVPKRKRILSSDSEHDDIEVRKTEYEREDPDYEPVPDKYKQPKKVSRSNVSNNKPQETAKLTTKNTDIVSTNTLNHKNEPDANKKATKLDILSSPKKDKEKDKSSVRIENGHESSKHKYKVSSHQHKDTHTSSKSKERDEKHKMREKHRSSPHKKHSSVLLSPHKFKKDSELSFKLSNATKKDTSTISEFPSTKEAVNDSSSTEAIKKMLSGEKPMQLEKKSQQLEANTTYHLNKEKNISHERKNADKLFPRNPRHFLDSSDSSEARKNQFQTASPGKIHRSQNIEEQTKRTTGIERDKHIQQQLSTSHNSKENHNLLSCIMTEMEKKN